MNNPATNIPTFATDDDAIRYATLSDDPLTRRLAELAAETVDKPELDAFMEALETRELPANFDECDAADMIDTWTEWNKWTLSDLLETDWYRAARCYAAADESTHAERIQDTRDAVHHAEEDGAFPPMIAQKLELEIDAVEAFHRGEGSLDVIEE